MILIPLSWLDMYLCGHGRGASGTLGSRKYAALQQRIK
jgi:hypothetical protein